jgi:tRNA modification GTPase
MDHPDYSPLEPIAALSTPWGQSALALVRVSGAGSLGLLEALFDPSGALQAAPGHAAIHGRLRDPAGGELVDEVLVIVYRAPRSFTGEESAEICTHGSPLIVGRVLDLLNRAGFRPAGPGEFTLRAFLNRKLDLTQAEAVNEIVRARTDRARALALHRLAGSVEGRIRELKQRLLALEAAVEVRLDYPEEDLPGELAPEAELDGLEAGLAGLASSYRIGRLYQEGVTAVLAGRTNSGKSTLFNRLLREERAIVSEAPGTTRDYLEGGIELEGVPVRLFDTAGYGEAGDPVEREGQRRTDTLVEGAQLVLYLVDAAAGLQQEDRRFLERRSGQPGHAGHAGQAGQAGLLALWAKADLPGVPAAPAGFLAVSAATGRGIGDLAREMGARILAGVGPASGAEAVIDSLRQKELLDRALSCFREFRAALRAGTSLDLLAVDLRESLESLGRITGEVVTQDILAEIFSRFCVGK